MVTGIESFKEWFKGNESQYAIIGGTACDILMTEEGLDFRATKDIDLVLIIEAVDADFGRKFWDYVKQAGYEHCNKSSGVPQFYRFSHPTSNRYPAMIELFTRKLDAIQLPDDTEKIVKYIGWVLSMPTSQKKCNYPERMNDVEYIESSKAKKNQSDQN